MEEIKNVESVNEDEFYQVAPISVDDIRSIANSEFEKYSVVDWHEHEVVIRHAITYGEMKKFVDAVADSCFDPDSGEFVPENRDFMYKYCEIAFFTNVELPTDSIEAYDIVYAIDLNQVIEEHIDAHQLADMQYAIDALVEYRTESRIGVVEAELQKLQSGIASFGEMVSSIDPDEVRKAMEAISAHGGIDEEKIVKTLLSQKADGEHGEANH